jgi:hypothetical protein
MVPDFVEGLRFTGLPVPFWRVQHGEPQAQFDARGDIVAKIFGRIPQTEGEFREAVYSYLQWRYSKRPSCFLSVFDDHRLSDECARNRYKGREDDAFVVLYEINSHILGSSLVFRIDELRSRLGLQLNRDTSRESLILHRIPREAVGKWTDIGALVERGMSFYLSLQAGAPTQVSSRGGSAC